MQAQCKGCPRPLELSHGSPYSPLPSALHLAQLLAGDCRLRPNVLELGMQGSRKVNPHYLESYRMALQAAMLLQFTRRGTPRRRAGVLALGQSPALRAIFDAEGCAGCISDACISMLEAGVGHAGVQVSAEDLAWW